MVPVCHPEHSPTPEALMVPVCHPEHSPTPETLVVPVCHPEQSPTPETLVVPVCHPEHSPTPEALVVPVCHPEQSPTPETLVVPVCHPEHSPTPETLVVPVCHPEQSPTPEALVVPVCHPEHSPTPETLVVPVCHPEHSPTPEALVVPVCHPEHSPTPETLVVPVCHPEHSPTPETLVVPVCHPEHSPTPETLVVPVCHPEHSPTPEALVGPVCHPEHSPTPETLVVPVCHPEHSPTPEALVGPVCHPEHSPTPETLVVPVCHPEHSPTPEALVVPVCHPEQSPTPEALVVPVCHPEHSPTPEALVVPVCHPEHSPTPEALVVPSQVVSRNPGGADKRARREAAPSPQDPAPWPRCTVTGKQLASVLPGPGSPVPPWRRLLARREAQKLRFGPWLVRAVSSGSYRGLCWTDPSRSTFRVPWKHNARKDVSSSDLEIFKAWAKASGRYEGCPEDPTKWKTNFRCALRSTRMFVLLEDRSKCGDDPHKVFAIVRAAPWQGEEGDFSSADPAVEQQPLHQQLQLEPDPQDMAPKIAPPDNTDPTRPPTLEELQWELQQCDISPRDFGSATPSWAPAVGALHQDSLLQPHPDSSQNSCPPVPAFQQWVSVAEQPPLGAYSPLDPMLLEEQGAAPLPCHLPEAMPSPGGEMLFAPAASPVPPPPEDNTDGIIPILDISFYYRGQLLHQEEVRGSQWLLAYQLSDPAVALRPGQLVRFPSPAELPDHKQRRFTEELLSSAGLQLEQRSGKLFATRLKKCKVFWALSQQLQGSEEPPLNLLYRDQETPIFDFNEFCTELRDFRNSQRQRSPDFKIYLCFGQSFSKAKPKESKLILVKLVPKFCEYWYDQVLREGASSLDSGTVSLQLSDSFSLYELIEQYNMQID
ncbi:interferon regulatory factor 7 [Aegotheles albertisi]